MSLGGSANGGETGAAGTVYLRKIGSSPETKLLVYNQKGKGVCSKMLYLPLLLNSIEVYLLAIIIYSISLLQGFSHQSPLPSYQDRFKMH